MRFPILFLMATAAYANSNYYNQYGTYEGSAITFGNRTNYYNYRGDYMGSRLSNDYGRREEQDSYYQPPDVAPVIPGAYDGLDPVGTDTYHGGEW